MVNESSFINNTALNSRSEGGAMWVQCDINFVQTCNYTLYNSTFDNNLAGLAGGMMKFNYY